MYQAKRENILIFLGIISSSNQTNYTCNSNVSCGCSINSTTVNRIANGETAETGAWGWAVSLSINKRFLCGGSVLSSSWIITAAHCVYTVIASEIITYTGSNIRWSGNQSRIASRVIVHPDYNTTTLANDIALVKLVSPLIMADPYVRAICVPSANSTVLAAQEWPVPNTTVIAVGWGRLAENGSLPSALQQVTLNTVDYRVSTCASEIGDRRVQFCAGVFGGGKDTCQGDSGGPLMMYSSTNQWVLVGLTSYGTGCALPEYMGVYTRVAAFQDWINSTMNTAAYIQTRSLYNISLLIFLYFLLY